MNNEYLLMSCLLYTSEIFQKIKPFGNIFDGDCRRFKIAKSIYNEI